MDLSHLNVVDLAVFGVILLSGLLALFRGFVREVLAMGAWIGAFFASVYFFSAVKPWMQHHIHDETIADIASVGAVFCVALAILIPLGFFIASFVRGRALTAVDRSLGFVFGLLRGALVVSLLFMITLWLWPDPKKEPDLVASARTRPFMAYGAELLKSLLPKEDVDKMGASMQALDKRMEKAPSLEQLTTPAVANAKTTTTPPNNSAAPDTSIPSLPPAPPPAPGSP